jgi:hypothetical protein
LAAHVFNSPRHHGRNVRNRTERDTRLLERVADLTFLISMLSLFVAVLVFAGSVI